eukprot:CAMPEP_0176259908 /NCGR_PEP_ID=MMETSP0121_2-20121125/39312_1 /TAXON_ID=160619 /ORGANISM="Kryptoperidinium foliaceum, Strain CCMP 1326" /LENGTH=113 /DNA_ID=CAMNT_0017599807 /DNA_START=18 /DNA_END=359 /DNA_ORIENTATION=+
MGAGGGPGWQQQQRNPSEEEMWRRYDEEFDRDRWRRSLLLNALKISPLLVPVWAFILYFGLMRSNRRPVSDHQGTVVAHDRDGRAFIMDAYGNKHRMADFDLQQAPRLMNQAA